ncbi:RbsD/FucU domain-containing protein [Curtobacterium sp. SAFR-003]
MSDRFPGHATVPHAELKARCADARVFVRTGEATSYANVLLTCGVPF